MLLEAKVNRRENATDIGHIVDGKPSRQGIAASSLAGPVEATFRRIVKRITLEVTVVAGLELAKSNHCLEITRPPLVSICDYGEAATRCADSYLRVSLSIEISLTGTDVVSIITLEIYIVASRWCRASWRLPESSRNRVYRTGWSGGII